MWKYYFNIIDDYGVSYDIPAYIKVLNNGYKIYRPAGQQCDLGYNSYISKLAKIVENSKVVQEYKYSKDKKSKGEQ